MSRARIKELLDWRFLVTLVAVMALGWALYTIWSRVSVESSTSDRERDALAARLTEVEAARSVDAQKLRRVGIKPTEVSDPPAVVEALVGPSGPPGPAGADGRDGKDGAPGRPGASATGAAGAAGATGSSGEVGAAGKDGAGGPAGPQGEPGRDGKDGAAGKDGAPGPPGANGQSAFPFTFSFMGYTVTCTAPESCTTTGGETPPDPDPTPAN